MVDSFSSLKKCLMIMFYLLTLCFPIGFVNALSGSGTKSDPWLIGYSKPSDVVAYLDDSGTMLKISGNGKMMDFDSTDRIWGSFDDPYGDPYSDPDSYYSDIKEIIVESGVTSIGDFAFYDYTNLQSVTLPDSIINIGNNAFKNCYNLNTIKSH